MNSSKYPFIFFSKKIIHLNIHSYFFQKNLVHLIIHSLKNWHDRWGLPAGGEVGMKAVSQSNVEKRDFDDEVED